MKSYLTAAITRVVIATIFFFTVTAANAQSGATTTLSKDETSSVKFLGIQDDMILFNVSYPNPEAGKFSLIVKDQDGSVLYQGAYAEKGFYKQFRLPKTDRDRITFIIRNNREADIVRSFEINVNSHFVADVDIRKLH
ncbi:MAG TPA: hypothetical protein VGM30_08845 [Puia sp.]|jgi:hypothetical protein